MSSHLPILQVLLPLLAAPLCVLLRAPTAAWLTFALASAGSAYISLQLAAAVLAGGPISYELGGWAPPFGIEYVIDGASAALLVLVSGIAVLSALYARQIVPSEIEGARIYLFYACACLLLAGLLGIVATADAFNVFVFLEISSLSGYALIAMGRRRQALLAAFQYLVMGTIGGTFLLIALGFAYALTGTLNMADMAERLSVLPVNGALVATIAFALIGLAIKAAVFPLHGWLPAAYAEAPSMVATFISATGTKVAIYALARFSFTVFGAVLVFETLPVQAAGLLLGCLGMLVGAAIACRADDLRRILAWSSVSQIGYIVAGLSLATSASLTAGFLHIFAHGLIKAAMFAVAGLLALQLGGVRLQQLGGVGKRQPLLFAALVFGGLGLIGVPSTAGFVSKWALVLALIQAQQFWVLAAVLASSLMAVIYVWRIIETAWFAEPVDPPGGSLPAVIAPGAWLSIAALSALSLGVGLGMIDVMSLSTSAAQALLGPAP